LVYRLNFVMWRVRSVIGFLASYLFWLALTGSNHQIGSYTQTSLLTYIFVAGFLRNLVFSNISYSACAEIASGDLNNFLLKPFSYLKYWFSRDLADKLLNLIFFGGEIILLYLILRPVIVMPLHLLAFLGISLLSGILFFFLSFLVSSFSFWHPEHDGWPLRFLFLMIIDFLSGASIPLDIFPPAIIKVFKIMPFSYLVYYPAQVWLGQAEKEMVGIFLLTGFWLVIFYLLTRLVWRQGLKSYAAYGR